MVARTLDITDARSQLNRLDENLRDERVIHVTRHNKPVFALVDLDFLNTLIETVELLSDPGMQQMLAQSLADIAAGRVQDQESVKRELL